ncbi:MAG: stage II sporulation protein R [Clostridiales bacterium]|nr:stage II sporulation protein R [Clostridiales bacterium]
MNKGRIFVAILAAALALTVPQASGAPTPDYIRLHVIANSDGDYDQAIKLRVRDAVRETTADLLAGCDGAENAYETLRQSLPQIERAAAEAAKQAGYGGEVRASIGEFEFPDRVYGEELVPAGVYRAVRVILGEGQGKNWWCVVYPSMCLPEEMPPDAEVTFYSSVGNWIAGLFRHEEGA